MSSGIPLCPSFALCSPVKSARFWTVLRCRPDSSDELPVPRFFELNQSECRSRIGAGTIWWFVGVEGGREWGPMIRGQETEPLLLTLSSAIATQNLPLGLALGNQKAPSTGFSTCPHGRKVALVALLYGAECGLPYSPLSKLGSSAAVPVPLPCHHAHEHTCQPLYHQFPDRTT